MTKGGCFCGKIRYEIMDGDSIVANCHCSMCRRTSGAPFVTWLNIRKNTFAYTSGAPKPLQSSATGRREFCSDCGTPLAFFCEDRPNDVDVTTGSLDDPNAFTPKMAVHEESKLEWLRETE